MSIKLIHIFLQEDTYLLEIIAHKYFTYHKVIIKFPYLISLNPIEKNLLFYF